MHYRFYLAIRSNLCIIGPCVMKMLFVDIVKWMFLLAGNITVFRVQTILSVDL